MKKSIKIILIIVLTIIGLILIDTIQAKIFNNSPIISFKEQLNDNGSYVDKGILVNTYYCVKEKDIVTVHTINKFSKFSCPMDIIETNEPKINKKVIMINNKLYYETSKEPYAGPRCGVMDGHINSSVESTKIPQFNNQSNFGTGYGYQFMFDTIEVFIDGKIVVFEQLDN